MVAQNTSSVDLFQAFVYIKSSVKFIKKKYIYIKYVSFTFVQHVLELPFNKST